METLAKNREKIHFFSVTALILEIHLAAGYRSLMQPGILCFSRYAHVEIQEMVYLYPENMDPDYPEQRGPESLLISGIVREGCNGNPGEFSGIVVLSGEAGEKIGNQLGGMDDFLISIT